MTTTVLIIIIFIFCFVFFRYLFFPSIVKTKPKLKNAGYKLIYTDQKCENKKQDVVYSKMLYSQKYDLKGKPDFLFQRRFGGKIIPVELKSGEIKDEKLPHKGDLLQLIAYFVIVEETYGVKPKEGRLIYRDYMFRIKNTHANRKLLFETLRNMRKMLKNGQGKPQSEFAHCRYCVCRGVVCEYCK